MRTNYFHFALALVFFMLVVAAYAYWMNAVGAMGNDVAALKAEAATANATVEELTQNTTELSTLSAKEAAVENYFVLDSDIVPFLEGLQALGTSLGSTVAVDSVSEASDVRQHLNLAIHVDGSFDAVERTIGAIEYAPVDATVESLTLGSDSSGQSGWSASMTLWIGAASSSPITLPKTNPLMQATSSASSTPAATTTASTTSP